jgi:DNA-directed RNA polymerase beta' subunit
MTKRNLTESEISSILDYVQPQAGIPKEISEANVVLMRGKLRKQLESQEIYPKMIPKLAMQISGMYESTKAQAGESVGVILAQSFGQFQTQATLNTFHKAGSASSSGVPRFIELLSATKSPRGSSCIIRFKSHTESVQSLRKMIGSSIVEMTIGRLASSIKMHLDKVAEPWYEPFKLLYNDRFSAYQHCISITIDKKYAYEYSITVEQVAKKIEEVYSDLVCVYSTNSIGRIDVFIDADTIELEENVLSFITPENMVQVYIEEVVIPKLEELQICGITGIANIFYGSEQDKDTKVEKWYLETEGTNFCDVLAHPNVDIYNTLANNIWEIYNTLGIEATRQYLIDEFAAIVSGINPCHCKLLADKMTYNGTIASISRYAMRTEGSGALSKASFEETLDNLLNAGVNGERECTDGVSASIICGKLGKFGTGVCELKVDIAKLTQGVIFHNSTVSERKLKK